jgi:Uma2 family endonuclease
MSANSFDMPVRRFTVDEVSQMLQAGVIQESDRLELIDGVLFELAPQDPPHSSSVSKLTSLLADARPSGSVVRVQLPIRVSDYSLPEPDIALVEGPADRWDREHPSTASLVVEIANTSQGRDRRKLSLYAQAGVTTVWIVDVVARRVEVHEEPLSDGSGYARTLVVLDGGVLQVRDGGSLPVHQILPRL